MYNNLRLLRDTIQEKIEEEVERFEENDDRRITEINVSCDPEGFWKSNHRVTVSITASKETGEGPYGPR